MTQTTILSRVEVETMGPPVPEELADLGVGEGFLCDLALKHVSMLPEPTTTAIAERLCLTRALTEEILQKLYREKLIEVRLQTTMGATRYAMLDHGWDRLLRLRAVCGYSGAAPVSLQDYSHMMRLQSIKVNLPEAVTAKRDFRPDVVNIAVRANGEIYYEKQQVNLADLVQGKQFYRKGRFVRVSADKIG